MEARQPIPKRVWKWLDGRYDLTTLMNALLHVEIPINARTFYFGGITLFFFGVQVITGTLLAIYYQPTPDTAYDSILYIMNQVQFGWLIRSIHAWSANFMILFCVFHLLRVFFQGAYKKPREVTWIMGILLLGLTLAFGFTGYLLPWDQRAYWATTVGSEIAGAVPAVGQQMLVFLRAGTEITARTLSRFFGMHVLMLPLSLAAVLVVHITLVHQQGLADPDRDGAGNKPAEGAGNKPAEVADEVAPATDSAAVGPGSKPKRKLLPFFPNYVLDEVIAWYVMLGLLIILVSLVPAGLEAPADPLKTPEHTKPEWYFLFLYQGLKVVPRIIGVAIPIVGGLFLLLLPFLDRNPSASPRRRPIAMTIGVLVIIGIVFFTVWGWKS